MIETASGAVGLDSPWLVPVPPHLLGALMQRDLTVSTDGDPATLRIKRKRRGRVLMRPFSYVT